MTPKTYTQQRAVLRPNRNVAFFDDDDFEDDIIQQQSHYNHHHHKNHNNDIDVHSMTDDGSSLNSVITNTDTLMLAQFLASTGPEEFLKPTKQQQQNPQFHRASRIFNKLRKKGGNVFNGLQNEKNNHHQHHHTNKTNNNNNNNNKNYTNNNSIRSIKSQQSHPEKKNYIPLPVYQPPSSLNTKQEQGEDSNDYLHPLHSQQQQHHHHELQIKPSVSTSSSSSVSYHRQKRNLSISSSSSHHTALRDSGIYSETSDKCGDDIPPPLPSPPMIPSKSYYRIQSTTTATNTSTNQQQQPRRPAPLPPAVASAAIASATSTSVDQYTSMDHSSFNNNRRKSIGKHPIPSAALKRKSITRIRHIQVQTDNNIINSNNNNNNNNNNSNNSNNVCTHCHQHLIEKNINTNNGEYKNGKRRTSCPSVLPTGQLLMKNSSSSSSSPQLNPKDAIQLLSMIEQLKLQLAEEQKSRLQLEEIIQRQLNGNKL